MNRAVVLGINGQDGIYLSKLLLRNNLKVFGVGSQESKSPFIDDAVSYEKIDVRNTSTLVNFIQENECHYIFNLAGLSSVADSFSKPLEYNEINNIAVKNLLSSIYSKISLKNVRFYQASTCEVFGSTSGFPQDEATQLNPLSPYAESKANAQLECVKYRDSGFFVSVGILFNHESIYRPLNFVSRKVTRGVAEIYLGKRHSLQMGNLSAVRDWGFAGDYVEAIFRMSIHDKPETFVVATGIERRVSDLVRTALAVLDLEGRFEELIETSNDYLRPRDAQILVGNFSKIRNELGWSPKTNFKDLIGSMVRHDLLELESRL